MIKPSRAVKGEQSLLSQVTLHFEYDKTIPEVRAALNAKTSAKR